MRHSAQTFDEGKQRWVIDLLENRWVVYRYFFFFLCYYYSLYNSNNSIFPHAL